jgi:hypothetical protein
MSFYLTRHALARLRLSTSYFIQELSKDLHRNCSQLGIAIPLKQKMPSVTSMQFSAPTNKPIVFASYCAGQHLQGHDKFCGGDKQLNCLVKLLRERGYEAYIVTYQGDYEPWLLDHQPYISLDKFRSIVEKNVNVRCVTSWAHATAFIQASPSIYFWDMELAHTEHVHFPELAKLHRKKIANTAAISRTIQAWHMVYFKKACTLLPNLVDAQLWSPATSQRNPMRVGYMDEGPHTESYIKIIQDITVSQGLNLEFLQLQGTEDRMIASMRSCTVFLTLNLGKDSLWGEGGPLPPLEAMATGCIPITFDILGPREIIQNGFNGIIVPRYRPDLMAEALIAIYSKIGEIKRFQQNALELFNACHTFDARWFAVKEFLNL